jgi:serine/threonine-protein kinase
VLSSTPELFGPYRLDELIGCGGMGEVFRAYDARRNRVVALKRLTRQLASDPEYRVRFRRESALAAKLREPHIIPIHDFGEINGQLFIDMRLVQGIDLAAMIRMGLLTPARTVDVVSQIADALDAAHAEKLVHRDVKPSNVLLVGAAERAAERGFAYLVDFGVASTLGGSTLSRPGLAVGTASYMAPERMIGDSWDHRADVYSLACMFYECLAGRRPFAAEDLLGVLQAHLKLPPPRPSALRPELPRGFDDIVARGMAKDAADRFLSAGELAAAARKVLEEGGLAGVTPMRHTPSAPLDATKMAPVVPTWGVPPIGRWRPDADATELVSPGRVPSEIHTELIRGHTGGPAADATELIAAGASTNRRRGRRGGRARWIAAIAAFGVILVLLAIFVPRLLPSGPAAFTHQATVTVGLEPTAVALSPDGSRAYVTNNSDGTVSVIDTATATPIGQPIPVGEQPQDVVTSPDGKRVYVTNTRSAAVSVIDAGTDAVVSTVKVGRFPGSVAIAPDGSRLYVANMADGTISVLDTALLAVVGPPIPLDKNPAATTPAGLTLSPDGGTLYVADNGTDEVTVIDTKTGVPRPPIPVGDGPVAIAVSADGHTVYVANEPGGSIAVIDAQHDPVFKNAFTVGAKPTGVALSHDGNQLYVTARDAGTLTAYDAGTFAKSRPIDVGKSPVAVDVSRDGNRIFVVGQDSTDLTVLTPVTK